MAFRETYEEFVKKFTDKPKTTDDCYTPRCVYEEVVRYVNEKVCPLDGYTVVRPFYPGGDYENYDYPENAFVLDNPPFSILAKIEDFYIKRGIKFFLFCPSLTAFNSLTRPSVTVILANAQIVFENKAKISCSFVTNAMPGDYAFIVDGELCKRLEAIQPETPIRKNLKLYPNTLCNAAVLGKIATRGVTFAVKRVDAHHVRKLDSGQGIFGSGVLLSERAAAERAAAERAAAERAAAEPYILSPRELQIIKGLGRESD